MNFQVSYSANQLLNKNSLAFELDIKLGNTGAEEFKCILALNERKLQK